MFEAATNMPEDCEALRLRLRLEYTRLLDWGDLAGLSDPASHPTFDRKLKSNRTTILALLGELKTLIEKLHDIGLRSEEAAVPPGRNQRYRTAGHGQLTMSNSREAIPADDLDDELRALFRSPTSNTGSTAAGRERHPLRGLNHIVKLGRGVAQVGKHPGRLRWAIKDKKEFNDLLRRLKELTDFLHESLGDHQMGILLETTKETSIAMLQMTTSVHEMKELLVAINNTDVIAPRSESHLTRSWLPLGETPANGGYRHTLLEQLTRFRCNLINAQHDDDFAARQRRDIRLRKPQLTFPKHQEDTSEDESPSLNVSQDLATYDGAHVWVEWKKYRKTRYIDVKSGSLVIGPSPGVTRNVESLVFLLHLDERPAQFRAPLCAGFFDDQDNDRFGLVYRFTEQPPSQPMELLSLSRVLQGGAGCPESHPSLRQRVDLAVELATSVYFLHAVNWLHKGLRSQSILFATSESKAPITFTEPYISGFEYSRPDEGVLTTTSAPDEQEWAIYAHPDYQGPGRKTYRKTYDIYSLGIILLEIALWKPAREILGFTQSLKGVEGVDGDTVNRQSHWAPSPSELSRIRARLISGEPEILDQVRRSVGDRYHDALRACIGGLDHLRLPPDVDETEASIAVLLHQAFLNSVVDMLRSIAV